MNHTVFLENGVMCCTILPDDGGRLVSLRDSDGNEYIWENIRTKHLKRYYGANYDNMMAGGVEEAFPTGLADVYKGDEIPFFGEIWSAPWQVISADAAHVELMCYSAIYPVQIRKTYYLHGQTLDCHYAFHNLSDMPVKFLFGVHPSFVVDNQTTVLLGNARYTVGVAENTSDTVQVGQEFSWPNVNGDDLSTFFQKHAQNACIEFRSYALEEGVVGIHKENKGSLELHFDCAFFPALSTWLIGGGWRGHECLMAEFFTGYPFQLSKAVDGGFCPSIEPHGYKETTIQYKLR